MVPRKSLTHDAAWAMVVKTEKDPSILLGLFSNSQLRRIKEAKEALHHPAPGSRRERYKHFLLLLLHCEHGEGLALLCVLSLAQKVVDMSKTLKHNLFRRFEEHGQRFVHITVWQSHAVNLEIRVPRLNTSAAASTSTHQAAEGVSTNSNNAHITTGYQNAPISGIESVFSKRLSDAITRIKVDGELRALVTMVFPEWTLSVDSVECLMSLDVCNRSVIEELAMTLFGAKLQWVGNVLHVVLSDGTTLIGSNAEITLKGATDGALQAAFGNEIAAAVSNCPVRRRELQQGRQVTECGSMIIMEDGAIINLSLDLLGGLSIHEKLYG